MNTQAAYFIQPQKIELRDLTIEQTSGDTLYSSVIQGISAGTEMLFFNDLFPKGDAADEVISELSGDMAYPIKYGYLNVGKSPDGTQSFFFYPHQLHWYAPENTGISIPDDIAADDAIFLAQVETALGIVQDLHPVAGETVIVAGAGVIGLLTASILKLSHWGPLFVADINKEKAKWCERFGLEFVDTSEYGWESKFLDRSGIVDCCVNATSSNDALQMLINIAGFEARIVEASWYGSKPVTLNLGTAFHRKRMQLVSSQVSHIGAGLSARWNKSRRFEKSFDLIREIRPSNLISHRFPFSRIQEAFECIQQADEQTMQVVLDVE